MSSSVGMMTFPIWKVIKTMFQSPPTRKEPALFFFFSFSSSSPSCRVHHGVRVSASVKHQWTLGLAEIPWCPSNNRWSIMVQLKHYPLDHENHSFSWTFSPDQNEPLFSCCFMGFPTRAKQVLRLHHVTMFPHFHSFSPWNSPIIPWNSGLPMGAADFDSIVAPPSFPPWLPRRSSCLKLGLGLLECIHQYIYIYILEIFF